MASQTRQKHSKAVANEPIDRARYPRTKQSNPQKLGWAESRSATVATIFDIYPKQSTNKCIVVRPDIKRDLSIQSKSQSGV